eukprot:363764-Chlamydomonas_euryale.AAC.3
MGPLPVTLTLTLSLSHRAEFRPATLRLQGRLRRWVAGCLWHCTTWNLTSGLLPMSSFDSPGLGIYPGGSLRICMAHAYLSVVTLEFHDDETTH